MYLRVNHLYPRTKMHLNKPSLYSPTKYHQHTLIAKYIPTKYHEIQNNAYCVTLGIISLPSLAPLYVRCSEPIWLQDQRISHIPLRQKKKGAE
jgi:hypothetical protein